MTFFKKTFLILQIILYAAAGINHFVHPAFYIAIIPHYIPYPTLMNTLAGLAELLLATMLIFERTRKWGAWGIILMLIAFMPVHIQMLIDAPMTLGKLHVTKFGAWIRILFQPVLIAWAAWYIRDKRIKT
ncbi:DoxX family protein [Mucilaginibacter myungsuensis]|uniref:DoxX family protein n=1 Tax=Mucilaginibacter myungsuensis TaxID=649104 RepID=A0A929PWW4_9SPHI|nr:MauE/DoxX family redox-associated membrane protein [Mucilaginibacter myungsuensis]MBE9662526.1 DoxX family protein [Mucilaginibacter myungsuensis]MDN3597945.1 DoxX family protein [Mucilaginibacter myungsuensis]